MKTNVYIVSYYVSGKVTTRVLKYPAVKACNVYKITVGINIVLSQSQMLKTYTKLGNNPIGLIGFYTYCLEEDIVKAKKIVRDETVSLLKSFELSAKHKLKLISNDA